jgi:hypothetical protein
MSRLNLHEIDEILQRYRLEDTEENSENINDSLSDDEAEQTQSRE